MTNHARDPQSSSGPLLPIDGAGGAIVVGVQLHGEDSDVLNEDLNELSSLLGTLGVKVLGRVVQRRQKFTPKCLIGEGKAVEIREIASSAGARTVVFDRQLSPPQVRNLEQLTGCEVLDRTGVILAIFAKHARSTQAKTQVEIAQLEYMMPRMGGAWTHLDRQKGGVNSRGMGEKQIEVDRRRARERISRLSRQLDQIRKDRLNQRKARRNELKVAIVGYTNSGKTSIMIALTKAEFKPQDVLFATLDASVRTLDPNSRPRVLLSDTVGFIRNLPHGLVESFMSTLDEVLEADLLLHVVDVSHENFRAQMQTTEDVLREIGAGDIPSMYVFNKVDRLEDLVLPKILRAAYKSSVFVSAYNEEDMVRLRRHILSYFEENLVKATLEVPPDDQVALSLIYQACLIMSSEFNDAEKSVFEVRAHPGVLAKLHHYVVSVAERGGEGVI